MEPYTDKADLQTSDNLWNAIYALAFGVAGLITSEFLPVSLLTPIANDLRITEGIAGQAISITAIVAMVAGLLTVIASKNIDRRSVLLTFCILQVLSNITVAFAPNFLVFSFGRILLGIAVGGFWTMMAATAMRLVTQKNVPKALSIIFGAVSVATVVAAPLGSFLGKEIGWRNVFLFTGILGAIALVLQAATLPSMKNEKPTDLRMILDVLKQPKIKAGMIATLFVFIGYATFFTYLRPFLEIITGVNVNQLSLMLLGFGIANLGGTLLARYLLEGSLMWTLICMPLMMGLVVGSLVFVGEVPLVTAILIAIWGIAFGGVQVGWPTWLTKIAPADAESAGAIQIAATQLAITTGAATGGFVFDLTGPIGVFICSSIITLIASFFAWMTFRKREYNISNAGYQPASKDKRSCIIN
jgi:predicted MFS family arabinose efflux permease